MEALKGWILTICSGLFFTIAVEMILPSNGMKKYAKFVLGLILMMIIINPLIKFFNNGFDVNAYASKAAQYLNEKNPKDNLSEYKEKNIQNTANVFKVNLETACEKKLKEKYPKEKYKASVQVKYDKEIENFIIEHVNIGAQDLTVEKVEKVEIKTSSNFGDNKKIESEEERKIKEYLSEELKISKENISITKL